MAAELRPIFVSARLDELGLRPGPFRVYAHLARRANVSGVAWPSVRSIAQICRMDEDTVWKYLRELESCQLLKRESRNGTSSMFRLTDESEWSIDDQPTRKNRVPRKDRVPEKATEPPPETTGCLPPENFGHPPPETTGCEGIPMKESSEGDPKKGDPPKVYSDSCVVEIYGAYPRKVGRQDALKAIKKAMQCATPERLLERTEAYARATSQWNEQDKRFIPHPATWFNRGSYDDDPATWLRSYGHSNQTPASDHSKGF